MAFEVFKNNNGASGDRVTIRKSGVLFIPRSLINDKYAEYYTPYIDRENKLIGIKPQSTQEKDSKKLNYEKGGAIINIVPMFNQLKLKKPSTMRKVCPELDKGVIIINLKEMSEDEKS